MLLQQLRRDSGLTQAQVAARAGTSQAAVARYETGVVSPSVATLRRLTHACGAMLEIAVTAAPRTDLSGHRARQLRQNRGRIKSLARGIGANNVRVFGSVARGDDTEDSDIDLLVDYDITAGLGPILTLKTDLEDLLGQSVDVAPLAALKPEVARAALAEAVPL